MARGYALSVSRSVVAELSGAGLQDDARFTEGLVRIRSERGYGPQRIAAELRQHAIEDALIARILTEGSIPWREQIIRVYRKRYGEKHPDSDRERIRAVRFLRHRGFSSDHIRFLFDELESGESAGSGST
jgi:regulatory protein